MYACMYVYIYIYTHVYICIYIYTLTYAYIVSKDAASLLLWHRQLSTHRRHCTTILLSNCLL